MDAKRVWKLKIFGTATFTGTVSLNVWNLSLYRNHDTLTAANKHVCSPSRSRKEICVPVQRPQQATSAGVILWVQTQTSQMEYYNSVFANSALFQKNSPRVFRGSRTSCLYGVRGQGRHLFTSHDFLITLATLATSGFQRSISIDKRSLFNSDQTKTQTKVFVPRTAVQGIIHKITGMRSFIFSAATN